MGGIIVRWLLNALALLITSGIVKGIQIEGFTAALVAALVLGIVNAIIRPLIVLFTLPINILTLGLFTFVINGFMLLLVSGVVKGFNVHGFGSAIIGSLVLSIISYILSAVIRF